MERSKRFLLEAGAALILAAPAAHAEFRALVGANGVLIADPEQYEVGPMEGEVESWCKLGIRPAGLPPDVLSHRQEGGQYRDQHGGIWTVKRLWVLFRNPEAVCDTTQKNKHGLDKTACYFLVPEFGAYQRDKDYRIVGVISKAEWERKVAQDRAKSEADEAKWERKVAQDRAKFEADEAKRKAEGFLLPHEMTDTPMFHRLRDAIAAELGDGAIRAGKALKPGEWPKYELAGHAGDWELVFEREEVEPGTHLARVPGRALEAAGFALSGKRRALLDVRGKGIQDVDTIGLDPYVIKRAYQEALRQAGQTRPSAQAGARARELRGRRDWMQLPW